MSMQELLQKLKMDYLADLPQKLDDARLLFNQKRWDSLQDAFHKLKGSGKTYGVPEVSQICLILEKACEQNPQNIFPLFEDSLLLLADVAKVQLEGSEFPLADDPRYKKLQSLLN